jgi:hypothetical protein
MAVSGPLRYSIPIMKNSKISKALGYSLLALLSNGLASAAGTYRVPVVSDVAFHLPSAVVAPVSLPVSLPVMETPLIVIGAPINLPSPINDPMIEDYRLPTIIDAPVQMPSAAVLPIVEARPVYRTAGRILHGDDAKGPKQNALDKVFDNIKVPEKPAVDAAPVKKGSRPAPRPITLPESDLENEIGLP